MTSIYIVSLYDYDCNKSVGYFIDYKKAKDCCDYLNRVEPSDYRDDGYEWQIITFGLNTDDYTSMLKELNNAEKLEFENELELVRQEELKELHRLKAKYENTNNHIFF